MKFRFKIQEYQTDAVESVVRVFKGQLYSDGVSYHRDLGEVKPVLAPVDQQLSLFPSAQFSLYEIDDTGYLNDALQLTDEQLLKNIHDVQQGNDIHQSASLVKGLGRCALDIEMETGTGKCPPAGRSISPVHPADATWKAPIHRSVFPLRCIPSASGHTDRCLKNLSRPANRHRSCVSSSLCYSVLQLGVITIWLTAPVQLI